MSYHPIRKKLELDLCAINVLLNWIHVHVTSCTAQGTLSAITDDRPSNE